MPTSSFSKKFVISREKFEEIQKNKGIKLSELLKDFESKSVAVEEVKDKLDKALENEDTEK